MLSALAPTRVRGPGDGFDADEDLIQLPLGIDIRGTHGCSRSRGWERREDPNIGLLVIDSTRRHPCRRRSRSRPRASITPTTGKNRRGHHRWPTFQRETLAPGWHWSTHVKPVASGESCQKYHVGIILSGRQRVAMEDRTEVELGPAMSASSSPATTRGVSATSPTCCSSSRRPSAKRRRRHERKGTRTSTGSWRRSGGRRRVGPSPAAAGADGPVHRPPPCSATVAGPNSEEPN
jgi:hypothetical protein